MSEDNSFSDEEGGDDVLVVFTPSGKRGRVRRGTNVLSAARQIGVDLDSVCGGRGICGRCQVSTAEGSFPKFGIEARVGNVSERGEVEERYDRIKGLREGYRLGCSTVLLGDMVVDVPAESQIHRQVVRKDAVPINCSLSPSTRPLFVEVEEADMDNPSGDSLRLRRAVEEQWQIGKGVKIESLLLGNLQRTLRKSKWEVTVALREEENIVGVYEGLVSELYGVAIDLGTTTISGHLCSLQSGKILATGGKMNPQIRYGEDLMSRVSYGMMNRGGVEEMTRAVRSSIRELLDDLVEKTEIEKDRLVEIVLVSNPVMQHLFLGVDPVELGGAPFAMVENESLTCKGIELGIEGYELVYFYFPPCIAGHVGADAAGVMLSEGAYKQKDQILVIDVGTNAELTLGNDEKIFACSSPTGPALEGAQIKHGQRATFGAIERVRIDKTTKKARVRVIGSEKWSDEEGFLEDVGERGVTGICGSGIIEAIAEMLLSGVMDTNGVICGYENNPNIRVDGRRYSYLLYDSGFDKDIYVTQDDVREVQLAKGAVYAGAKLLMDRAGLDKVDKIKIAGAFGSHIDVKYAMILGMIPDARLQDVSSIGNAAGTGACIALLNCDERKDLERVVTRVEKIETAIEPKFQEFFVNAMAIPNGFDSFDNLWQEVEKPPEMSGGKARGNNKRERRRAE